MPIYDYNNNNSRAKSKSVTEKRWWQKLIFIKKKSANTTINEKSIKSAAQDWRTLSPDDPPLPFLFSLSNNNTVPSMLNNPGSVVPSSIKFSDAERFTSELAPIIKECKSNTVRLLHRNLFSSSAAGRELYTIEESSEASYTSNNSNNSNNNSDISIKEDSITRNIASSSIMSINTNNINTCNVFNNNDNISLDGYETAPSSWSISPPTSPHKFKPLPTIRIVDVKYEDSSTTIDDDDTDSLSISNATNKQPLQQSKMILVEDDEEAEENPYVPIFEWPSKFIPSAEPHFGSDLIGNEAECRLQFCKLVAQAYQQYRQGRLGCPKEMYLLFDEKENIQGITLILRDETREDYLEFGGSPQYIAPELSICPSFNYEQSDIWPLGISLYRMLVGRFPFYPNDGQSCALSHRELFRKMLTSDFILPKTLSADVRDLIQRMLSPENSRASFDLVMFHPWIQPYIYWSDTVIKGHQDQATAAAAAATAAATAATAASRSSSEKNKNKKESKSHKRMKKTVRMIRKVIRIIFKGPYPPPSSYYDLVDNSYRQKKNQ